MNDKKSTSKTIASFDQLPAPANNWERFSDDDWALLLAAQPQFSEKCDAETLARLAKAKTSPTKEEEDSDTDDEDEIKIRRRRRRLVRKFIQNPDSARLRDLDFLRETLGADGWTELLSKQSDFISYLQTGLLSGGHWARLLVQQPWLAGRCEWGCMRGCDIAAVLSVHPEIADLSPIRPRESFWMPPPICPNLIDWARLQDGDWARLLAAQPRFVAQCPKEFGELRLAPDDWAAVLARRPEKATEFEKATLAYKVAFTLHACGKEDKFQKVFRPGGYMVSCGPIDESLLPRRGDDGSLPLLDIATGPLPSMEADIDVTLQGMRDGYTVYPKKAVLLGGKQSGAIVRDNGWLFEANPAVTGTRLWEELEMSSAVWGFQCDNPYALSVPMIGDFDETKFVLPYASYRTGTGEVRRVLLPHRMTYDGLSLHLTPLPYLSSPAMTPPRFWTVGTDGVKPYNGPWRENDEE